jgi:2Fe-2S ferredoxin
MPVVGEACDIERGMLSASSDLRRNSRLSCQIEVTPELEGLIVAIPVG